MQTIGDSLDLATVALHRCRRSAIARPDVEFGAIIKDGRLVKGADEFG